MYQSIHIKNFRCFEDLQVENLGQVNLIVGRNNAGKTALLEALYLLGNYPSPEAVMHISVWRGLEPESWQTRRASYPPWTNLFHMHDGQKAIEITQISSLESDEQGVCIESNMRRNEEAPVPMDTVRYRVFVSPARWENEWRLTVSHKTAAGKGWLYGLVYQPTASGFHVEQSKAPVPSVAGTVFLPAPRYLSAEEDARRYSAILERREEKLVLNALRQVEPRLLGLYITIQGDQPILQGDIGFTRLIPLPHMGEGMVQMFRVSSLIASQPEGIVLLDEIENGLHYSVYPALWEVVAETAQAANAQVFAATHSYECIQAAVEVFAKRDPNLLRVHRLERSKGVIRAVTYEPDVLETAIEKFFEVR